MNFNNRKKKLRIFHDFIAQLEWQLGLRYVADINGGHTNASIIKLQRVSDGVEFVAKFYLSETNPPDLNHLKDNIVGYAGIKKIGASILIPNDYAVKIVDGLTVLVMRYLEPCFKIASQSSIECFNLLQSSVEKLTTLTVRYDFGGQYGKKSITETINYIRSFAKEISGILPANFFDLINDPIVEVPSDYVALFLLDFTPDNIFLKADGITYIDPWRQNTYLGHTAISIGQFIVSARDIYHLPNSSEGVEMLSNFALNTLPKVLGCKRYNIEQMLELGKALQLILSAYVRRNTDIQQAIIYGQQATIALTRAIS